ncbi:hypothetical protein MYAM1_000671 [Malassezia yamatoensis]|uniref:Dipeptidyl-peptidase V n=1 Tax=Malassezia yamatoensis TaxID=253288 RepID=A0AAJ5YPX0_9BASI|nr:hypothetical protein MYAM1_000671 [Malassezia yamatoensis]
MQTLAPHGAWVSPINADHLTKKSSYLNEVATHPTQRSLLFTLTEAEKQGRTSLKQWIDGKQATVPVPGSIRTKVHEYGGGALGILPNGDAIVSHQVSGKSFVSRASSEICEPILQLDGDTRYADFDAYPDGSVVVAVQECHEDGKVINSLACIDTEKKSVYVLQSGHDFYAYPRFSQNGKWIAYVTWDHPEMPFWSSQLWVAPVVPGTKFAIGQPILVAGQTGVAQQPVWCPGQESILYYTFSGASGGTIREAHLDDNDGKTTDIAISSSGEAFVDVQPPLWTLNSSSLVVLDQRHIAYIETSQGDDRVVVIDRHRQARVFIETGYSQYSQLRVDAQNSSLVAIASSPTALPRLIRIQLENLIERTHHETLQVPVEEVFAPPSPISLCEDSISIATPITFPSELPDGTQTTAHALYYPPKNAVFQAPADTSPPCRIIVHGGPTGKASSSLDFSLQYWTTRGWAVCAVNFGGSTGYGYEYMARLNGHWGDVDVRDCVNAALFLSGQKPLNSVKSGSRLESCSFRVEESTGEGGAKCVTVSRQSPALPRAGDYASLGLACLLFAVLFSRQNSLQNSLVYTIGTLLFTLVLRAYTSILSGRSDTHTESIHVFPHLGVQLESRHGFCLPYASCSLNLRTKREFISKENILDIFMMEAIQRFRIVDYLGLVCRVSGRPNSPAIRVVFPHLLPPVSIYVETYRKLHSSIFGPTLDQHIPLIDPKKICISGRSSGGFTVLRALADYPEVFRAGYSGYGVCDLARLNDASHKFESHYIARLLGDTAKDIQDVYAKRNPVTTAHRIRVPILLSQGSDDKIVPPEQSRSMAESISQSGGQVEYLEFEGEGHGTLKCQNF